MHWCPRHTPSTGTPRPPKSSIAVVRAARRPRDGPGPGRDQERVGLERAHLVERDVVVAVHDRLGAELTEVLHEVVDERVVVVDHEHAGSGHGAHGRRSAVPAEPRLSSGTVADPKSKAPSRRSRKRSRTAVSAGAARPRRRPRARSGCRSRCSPCSSCGAAIVILNYLGVLPGEQQNRYLFLGLVEITAGFVFATRYR